MSDCLSVGLISSGLPRSLLLCDISNNDQFDLMHDEEIRMISTVHFSSLNDSCRTLEERTDGFFCLRDKR
jgi:hypothetical protein